MRKEVNQMQLAGHGIRVIVATMVAFTALASITPSTHGAPKGQATILCPPMC